MLDHIPIRLDYYLWCAETWTEIFRRLNVGSLSEIIDICPGWSPKIELALLRTNFQGEVLALDKSKNNLQYFSCLLDPFQKQFKTKLIPFDMVKQSKLSCRENIRGDLVVANHIIDDVLVDYYLHTSQKDSEFVFENIEYLKGVWKEILFNKKLHAYILTLLFNFFYESVRNKGYIIITQYKGYQEKLYKMDNVTALNKNLMQEIKNKLMATKQFVDIQEIISTALNHTDNPYFTAEDTVCLRKR